jgi:hypothetical protein
MAFSVAEVLRRCSAIYYCYLLKADFDADIKPGFWLSAANHVYPALSSRPGLLAGMN